jgi:hypothetical protein
MLLFMRVWQARSFNVVSSNSARNAVPCKDATHLSHARESREERRRGGEEERRRGGEESEGNETVNVSFNMRVAS